MAAKARSSGPGCRGAAAVIAGACCLFGTIGLLVLAYVLSL